MAAEMFAQAISEFGAAAKAKLSNPAIIGAPEDQLRNPLETLLRYLAELGGMPPAAVQLVGETTDKHLKSRPGRRRHGAQGLAGFIEVKAPGKGADPHCSHRKTSWGKVGARA